MNHSYDTQDDVHGIHIHLPFDNIEIDTKMMGHIEMDKPIINGITSSLYNEARRLKEKSFISVEDRKKCIQWIINVCEEQGFHFKIFEIALNYLDITSGLLSDQYTKDELKVLVSTCVIISVKIEGVYNTNEYFGIPEAIATFGKEIEDIHFKRMECKILSKLNWNMNTITPSDIALRYLTIIQKKVRGDQEFVPNKEQCMFLYNFIEKTVHEDELLEKSCSISLGISCIVCIYETLKNIEGLTALATYVYDEYDEYMMV